MKTVFNYVGVKGKQKKLFAVKRAKKHFKPKDIENYISYGGCFKVASYFRLLGIEKKEARYLLQQEVN